MSEFVKKQTQDLVDKLMWAQGDLKASANYYDATYRVRSIGISTPPELRVLATAVGWPRMYLDALASRLSLQSFRASDSGEVVAKINEWWVSNNLDEEHTLGVLEALIYGRAYITISKPDPNDIRADPNVPVIRVESPTHLYADVDARTNKVYRAVRYYTDDNTEDPTSPREWATLYLPNATFHLRREGTQWIIEDQDVHNRGVVPVVPLVNRERLSDRMGQSQITPEIRSFTDAGQRTMMNMQAAMEIMALPQKAIFGVEREELVDFDENDQPIPGAVLDAYMGRILTFENEAGKAMQFQAADLRNFTEVLDQLGKHVASYTGLPPQYLSFSSDNPASAEAINASESRLVRTCELIAKCFGGDFEEAMLVACIFMGIELTPELRRLEAEWANPATPTYASVVDAATKAYANGNGVIPKERARIDIGYSSEERAEMREWDEAEADERAALLKDYMAMSEPAEPPDEETAVKSPEMSAKPPAAP